MATKTIKDTDIIKIYSNEQSVSHQPRNGEIYWLWRKNPYEKECYIEKTRKELSRELRESKGLRLLFDEGVLVTKDKDIVEEFRLNCLDEYIKNQSELEEFIENSTVEEFEEYCQYAPDAMVKNIGIICAEKELSDRRKIKIYKDYTGLDLEEYYKDNEDAKDEVVKNDTQTPKKPRKKVTSNVSSKEE